MFGGYTAVGYRSGLPKVQGTTAWMKDGQAFTFRLVCRGVVDNPPIKCNSKAGQGSECAVCLAFYFESALNGAKPFAMHNVWDVLPELHFPLLFYALRSVMSRTM